MTDETMRVLVVEDDPDGQEVFITILEHLNLSMDVANNVAEAEEFLFQSGNRYHAAIIDLALPDKDGWELLSEILAEPRTSYLPCIAVTAFHTSKLREDALKAGFTAYFSKPLDSTAFVNHLEQVL